MSRLCKDFLKYTFLTMGICWGTCVICSLNGILMTEFVPLYALYFLGGLSPTIGSFLALKHNGETAGFQGWMRTVFDFRHNAASYGMVVVFAAAHILTLCLICGYKQIAPLFAIVLLVPLMLFCGGLEETGWRGVLQPELEKRFGFAGATLITALIWWLWHFPLFLIPGVSQYGKNFLAYGVNVLGLSFALAAIRRNTNSSWLCVLFHCIINALSGIYIVGENILGNVVSALVLVCLSAAMLGVEGKWKFYT